MITQGRFWWLTLLLLGLPAVSRADDEVKVTVLAILGSSVDDKVCPKCAPIAREIQKRDPSLTGFHIERTTTKAIGVGKSARFPLVDSEDVVVTIEASLDNQGKISLTIEPPTLGAITYSCRCGKFLPVLTRHRTAAGDRLIVGIMAEPCLLKQPEK